LCGSTRLAARGVGGGAPSQPGSRGGGLASAMAVAGRFVTIIGRSAMRGDDGKGRPESGRNAANGGGSGGSMRGDAGRGSLAR
jgi:hypothetical protein